MPGEAQTLARLRTRPDVRVVTCGIGPEKARSAMHALLQDSPELVVVWGTAGAVDPRLRPGHIVLPKMVRDHEGCERTFDPQWRAGLAARLSFCGCFLGSADHLLTLSHPITSNDERRRIAEKHRVQVVDMETAAIAMLAGERGIPCVAVRVIMDTPDIALPSALGYLLEPKVFAFTAVAIAGLLRMSEWPRWWRLPAMYAMAKRSLREAANCLAEVPRLGFLVDSTTRPETME